MEFYGWWPGMGFMWMFPLVFIVGMALCAFFMFRSGWWGGHRHSRNERGESALDVLDRRFAQGEIDSTKYQEMRQVLHH